jgi:folate-binding protein YgfZ
VSSADQYRALRHGAGGRLVPRDVLGLSGPDAVSYLQGQCSQDVESMAVGTAVDALLLSPQGKLEALVRVQRLGDDRYLIDVAGGWGGAVRARLERFKLRVKADISELSLQCLSVRGPDAEQAVAQVESSHRVPFAWGGVTGVDVFAPSLAVPPAVTPCDAETWEALRVEAGIPAMGRELDDRTIAAEADLLERCVSFTKGCYTGQELVARLDARGNKVARHLAGFVVEEPEGKGDASDDAAIGAEPISTGTPVVDPASGQEVGAVTSSARSPALGLVALGYLHRRLSPPAPVELLLPGSAPRRAEARPLPLVA